MLKRVVKITAGVMGILVGMIILLFIYIRLVAVIDEPVAPAAVDYTVNNPDSGLFTIGKNWFRKSESGLYELYVEGSPYARGVINGALTKALVHYQEEVFTKQIRQLVPSEFYLQFLKYGIGYFNRNLDKHVPEEYQLEILGVSRAASNEFDFIAPAYQRILNYHAAHDIGHALQNMSLVGCTSFATWGDRSDDGSLIIGRNFDFYVGDDFARDKIVAFYYPDKGFRFMMVTFGGMTGVLSGMNEQGLTVTINAAKSEIPSGAATPVSLVAREILQYASTIDEAYAIAQQRKMFVAESFLIGSARDGRAAVIEKTPEAIDRFESGTDYIICTNHFQSESLGNTELNKAHVRTSASPYRYARVKELLLKNGKNTVLKTASILRNQKGLADASIGMGNEKLINQLVAHHGIIFQPEKKLVWVSTAPWQLGKFVCYDLNKIFSLTMQLNREVYEEDKIIPADSFLLTSDYQAYVKYSQYRFPFNSKAYLRTDSVVKWNPQSYHAYMLAGDYYFERKAYRQAKVMYTAALEKEIATLQEKAHIEKNLEQCNNAMQ